MSLLPNSQSSGHRIYKPSILPGVPQTEELSESTSYLLQRIRSYYCEARKRLGEAACSSLCVVGLLDPVSNLVVNNLLIISSHKRKPGHGPSRVCEGDGEDNMERRLLHGLVAFLTRLFPDLAESQAVRYLRLADADALVAARAIVSDTGMRRFDHDPTIVTANLAMALKCAALVAGHPDPDLLVYAWCRNISRRTLRHVAALSASKPPSRSSSSYSRKLARMLSKGVCEEEDVVWAWRLAASRRLRPCSLPYRHTRLLTRTLHDAIHGFYLQALARLPAGELRSRFHRSLLRAGYCYGPLDPVSNIIINTIWYDTAFPPTKRLELDIIGTESLHRMENRSLYGLASFLCTRYHRFSFQQAVRCLLQADANLLLADSNLASSNVQAQDNLPDTSVEEAFLAAATAAFHPNPDAQVKFLTSCKAMMGPSALSLLQCSDKLSSRDVRQLTMLLFPGSPPCEMGALLPLPLKGYPHAKLASAHRRISKRVNALLNAYEQMPNGVGLFCLLSAIANVSHVVLLAYANVAYQMSNFKIPNMSFIRFVV